MFYCVPGSVYGGMQGGGGVVVDTVEVDAARVCAIVSPSDTVWV